MGAGASSHESICDTHAQRAVGAVRESSQATVTHVQCLGATILQHKTNRVIAVNGAKASRPAVVAQRGAGWASFKGFAGPIIHISMLEIAVVFIAPLDHTSKSVKLTEWPDSPVEESAPCRNLCGGLPRLFEPEVCTQDHRLRGQRFACGEGHFGHPRRPDSSLIPQVRPKGG